VDSSAEPNPPFSSAASAVLLSTPSSGFVPKSRTDGAKTGGKVFVIKFHTFAYPAGFSSDALTPHYVTIPPNNPLHAYLSTSTASIRYTTQSLLRPDNRTPKERRRSIQPPTSSSSKGKKSSNETQLSLPEMFRLQSKSERKARKARGEKKPADPNVVSRVLQVRQYGHSKSKDVPAYEHKHAQRVDIWNRRLEAGEDPEGPLRRYREQVTPAGRRWWTTLYVTPSSFPFLS
jgi:hypothetical protein